MIEYFLYPKYGPGQMWDLVAEQVSNGGGVLKQNHKVVEINFDNNKVESVKIQNTLTGAYEIIPTNYCISTMPVN